MPSASQNGFYVSWEQVNAFFAMAEEALKAKTAANEVLMLSGAMQMTNCPPSALYTDSVVDLACRH
jgi:hypothetical protein